MTRARRGKEAGIETNRSQLDRRRKEANMSIANNRPTTQPCQCLRTKNPYGTTPQNAENWLPHVATSSTYWCLRTMGPAGTDEHFVHLSQCTSRRACYEAPEE